MAGITEDVFPDQLNLPQTEQPMTSITLFHLVEGEETPSYETIYCRPKLGLRWGSAHAV